MSKIIKRGLLLRYQQAAEVPELLEPPLALEYAYEPTQVLRNPTSMQVSAWSLSWSLQSGTTSTNCIKTLLLEQVIHNLLLN